jgi:hypothetical protein
MRNTCEIRTGRLLEVRIGAGYRTVADVDVLFDAIVAETTARAAATRVVVVADWRRCSLMSDEAAKRLLVRMTRSNPRTERSGAFASRDSSTAVLQFIRLVRESQNEERKMFFEREPLEAYLGERLTPAERRRLGEFLDEGERDR